MIRDILINDKCQVMDWKVRMGWMTVIKKKEKKKKKRSEMIPEIDCLFGGVCVCVV